MRLRRSKPYVRPFEPTHELVDGTRVRVAGEAWRVSSPRIFAPGACTWVTAEHPDRVMRPVNAERLRRAL